MSQAEAEIIVKEVLNPRVKSKGAPPPIVTVPVAVDGSVYIVSVANYWASRIDGVCSGYGLIPIVIVARSGTQWHPIVITGVADIAMRGGPLFTDSDAGVAYILMPQEVGVYDPDASSPIKWLAKHGFRGTEWTPLFRNNPDFARIIRSGLLLGQDRWGDGAGVNDATFGDTVLLMFW